MHHIALAALAAIAFSTAAHAQPKPFPDHTVKLIVPFTPGGNADVVARMVALGITDQLKQSIIVEKMLLAEWQRWGKAARDAAVTAE